MFLCGLGCEALVAQGPFRKATQHKFYAVQLLEGTLLKVDFFFFLKPSPRLRKGVTPGLRVCPTCRSQRTHTLFSTELGSPGLTWV